MKKVLLTAAIAAATLISTHPTYANEAKEVKMKEAAIFSTAVVGGLTAGPVGALVGAMTAAYVGDRKTLRDTQLELQEHSEDIALLEEDLEEKTQKLEQMKKAAANKLEFQVLFPTGEDRLTAVDRKRIRSLATYLNDNPKLKVHLDGHADPRGTDEFNNVLSEERALAVVKALEERGISRDRISYISHGSSKSASFDGNLEDYAMERRVNIEVFAPEVTIETTAMTSTNRTVSVDPIISTNRATTDQAISTDQAIF